MISAVTMHAAMGLDLHNLYHQPKGEEKKTKEPRKMVVLDVGGERFSAMRATLLRWNTNITCCIKYSCNNLVYWEFDAGNFIHIQNITLKFGTN